MGANEAVAQAHTDGLRRVRSVLNAGEAKKLADRAALVAASSARLLSPASISCCVV